MIPGGYLQIIEHLLRDIEARKSPEVGQFKYLHNHVVDRIIWKTQDKPEGENWIEIRCENKAVFRAKHAVITIPLGKWPLTILVKIKLIINSSRCPKRASGNFIRPTAAAI